MIPTCGPSDWYFVEWQRSVARRCLIHTPNIGGFLDCPEHYRVDGLTTLREVKVVS